MLDSVPSPSRMRPRRREHRIILLVVLVLVAAAAVTYAVWPRDRSTFTEAAAVLPKDTLRIAFTDWDGVRREVGAAGEATDDDPDLTSSSVIQTLGQDLDRNLGWGKRTVAWEILGQSRKGQVLVVSLHDGTDVGAITRHYRDVGFEAPAKGRLDGGVWEGGADVLSRVGIDEGVLQYVAFLPDEHLLLSSDDPDYLARAVKAARGSGLDWSLAPTAGDPLAAVGFVDDYACEALSFASADTGAQAEAGRLVDEAGGVSPLAGYLVALGPGRVWTASFRFESSDHAQRDERSRQALARADDPGQMQSYPDLFTLDRVDRDGDRLVLHGHARKRAYALSETTQGPVLLASC